MGFGGGTGRWWAAVVVAVVGATLSLGGGDEPPIAIGGPATAAPSGDVPGTGAARPRVLYDPGAEPDLRARLEREPYRTVFLRSHARADAYDDRTLGDLGVAPQRDLTRAAKIRAFEYALDRTVVGGVIVPFPDAAARQAVGDQVRDILLQILDRSRLAVPPPIGGWDRDISTSEEIINAATAYDTLLGAGYDLGADRTEIVRRLAAVTTELRQNFVDPDSAGGYTRLHQNNHRTKSGTALAVAAAALADDVPQATARAWFDTGVDYVDDMLRHVLVTGDGAYAEGPFYYRYTTQNLAPYLAVWERFLGASSWTTVDGLTVPSLADTAQFARTQRWMLDLTLPDGSMAPIDDGNPGRSHFFGVSPSGLPTASAAAWRWARTPQPYDTDGNIDLGPDVIATYDDSITAAPPTWAPTQFYVEGGQAILRAGWGADDAMAVVVGEHDTASEFGRDRTGAGRWPQSHEHAEPGSFLFHAYGERLALDPGYLTFTTHGKVNKPQDHNLVLIDGAGPGDYLQASVGWGADTTARPPAEGHATITATLDAEVADAATVVTNYRGADLSRRFLFGDDRYLVIADDIDAPTGTALTWLLHGNGGGTSGGSYEPTATGGRWTIGGGRLDGAVATSAGEPTLTAAEAIHEVPYTQERTHLALHADVTATGERTRALQLVYPTPSGSAAPTTTRTTTDAASELVLTDVDGDRQVTAALAAPDLDGAGSGGDALAAAEATTDGDLLLVDRHLAGDLRLAWAEGATTLVADDRALVTSATPGALGHRSTATQLDVVADTDSPTVLAADPGFAPGAVDGACGVTTAADGSLRLTLNRERRVTVRAAAGNGAPGADAGPDQRRAVGTTAVLDGRASCDRDGDDLTPRWELVSAPAGSSWTLTDADGWTPTVTVDRPGPYRVRLVVTDEHGTPSREAEALVIGGDRCADGVDDDLDGRIDTDDPDCDAGPTVPPSTTTSTSTSTSTTSTTSTPSTTTSTPGSSTSSTAPPSPSTTSSPGPSTTSGPPSPTTSGPTRPTTPGPTPPTGPGAAGGQVGAGGAGWWPAPPAEPRRGRSHYVG